MKCFISAVALLALFSCSSTSISSLKEMTKSDEKKCEFVKQVEVESDKDGERGTLDLFKKEVIKNNANSYMLGETINNGKKTKITGNAFNCFNK